MTGVRAGFAFTVALFASPGLAVSFSFTTIDFPGATQTDAFGINSSGEIVGYYVEAVPNAADRIHGFLARRVSEPSTLLLLGVALLVGLIARRGKVVDVTRIGRGRG
jgi:hypothetical protein